jgi:hypothetical protein
VIVAAMLLTALGIGALITRIGLLESQKKFALWKPVHLSPEQAEFLQ